MMSWSRRLSMLSSLEQIERQYYGSCCLRHRRRFFSSDFDSSSSPIFPTLREVPKTVTTSSGKFSWIDEYDWITKRSHAREFEAHVDAENRASSSFFSSRGFLLDKLAASLAAEARLLCSAGGGGGFSSSSSLHATHEDSVPERIGEYYYFTRTGIHDGSCSLLRKRRSAVKGDEDEVVVDVAEVARSQDAASLGQLKLSPCGGAVAMTLDVGGGGEFWRLVVVEAEGRRRTEGGTGRLRFLGATDGVTSVEWGGAPSPSPAEEERLLALPPLYYTRGGSGHASSPSSSTLHVARPDAPSGMFRFGGRGGETVPLFVEECPSRVLALGRSKDGALLTMASASASGSAAYAMWLPRDASVSSSSSSSSSPLPRSPSPLACVAPFEEGVEHYLEHCDSVPGGIVVMTTAEERGRGRGRSGEFWLAAPLAGRDEGVGARRRLPFPQPSEWPALLSTKGGEAGFNAVLTDVDVYREEILCYGRCPSTGRPRLSLLRDLGNVSIGASDGIGASDCSGNSWRLSPTLQRIELPPASPPPFGSEYCVVRPGANADPDATSARLELSSPTSPPSARDLDLETGSWSPPPTRPPPSLASLASRLEVVVERTEGGGVPVTIVRPRRRRSAGGGERAPPRPRAHRPVLLTLYGAYATAVEPDFDPVRLLLSGGDPGPSEKAGTGAVGGWDLAFAHLRGGGELGRRWHAAGRGSERPRVLEDAREVVEWLSRGGGSGDGGDVVSGSGGDVGDLERGRRGSADEPRRPVALCAESAGALVAGALLADDGTARLLSAVCLRVPFVDVLSGIAGDEESDDEGDRDRRRRQRSLLDHERGEFSAPRPSSPSGVDDDDVASSLASVCPYHLLLPSTSSGGSSSLPGDPAVLVTAAEHDARAPAAGAVKWVSRLRRLRGRRADDGRRRSPVVLEVLRGCGHADGLRRAEDVERNAREAAFMIDAVEREREEREREHERKER